MKRTFYTSQYLYIAIAFVAVCFIGVSHVRGAETTPPDAQPPHQVDVPPMTTNDAMAHGTATAHMNANAAANSSAHKGALPDQAQNRITNLARNLTNTMQAASARLRQIEGRVESRTQKLNDQGTNTSSTTDLLASIVKGLDLTDEKIASMPMQVESAVTSDDPRAAFKDIHAGYMEIRNNLSKIRSLLGVAVSMLKDAVKSADIGQGASSAVTNADQMHATDTSTAGDATSQ